MRSPRAGAAALALAALAAWLPSMGAVFQFDDYNVIVGDPAVRDWQAFVERAGSGIRPLLKASYALNWAFDPGPAGFHAVNIALHAVNVLLAYRIGLALCERWLAPAGAALVAALLFALHPAQTEAVTYLSGRSQVLMGCFYLGAMLLYLRGRPWTGALLFALALATRETAVTLPAALVLCELCSPARAGWRGALRRQAPYWAVLGAALAVVLAHDRYLELLQFGFTRRGVAENLLAQAGGISYLVLRLVSLHGYNIDPALPAPASWDGALALQAILLATLLATGLACLRRRPWLGFGILWFFLQLAPTNSIVPRLDVANDRQLYLAMWGLFLGLCVQAARATPRLALARTVALALVLAFAAANAVRQLDYRSEVALWEASVRDAPWNARGHNNLGYAYQVAGRLDDARREYRLALLFDPRNAKARMNLLVLGASP